MASNLPPTCVKCNCTLAFGVPLHIACEESEADEYVKALDRLKTILDRPEPNNELVDYVGLSLCMFGIHHEQIQSEKEILGKMRQVFECAMIKNVIDAELVRIDAELVRINDPRKE